jgi:diguanylate cyclase (GGDEF)-like protein
MLYDNSLFGIMFSAAASAILTFVYANGTEGKFTWWLAINLIMMVRLLDYSEWQLRSRKIPSNGSFGIFRFGAGAILTAILWSVHSVIFLPSMGVAEFCFTVIILSSFAGGAVPLLSPSKVVSLGYSLTLLVPIGIVTLISNQEYQQMLGYLILPSSILLIPICIKASKFTQSAILQKHQNEQLLNEMEKERERAVTSHHELKIASSKLNQSNAELEGEVKKRTDEIVRISNVDSLTQLLNRKTFTANLENLITNAQEKNNPLALLFIDLNGFKKINDTMGHRVGDSVLKQVTQRIVAFAEFSRVGRWGGDEFLVALPYSDEDTAMSIASAIITSIDQPIFVHGNELHLTAAVGIAMAPQHSASATELIQLADLTMCEQKTTSINAPRMFSAHLKEKIESSQKILEGLQHAIHRKQLYLCYQPIVKAKEHDPWAFEALLRWDFNGTFIGPDTFIPLAEKSGLIKEIGAWVLNRACMDAKHWQHCSDATVSVNVSVIQLMDDGFLRHLDNCLKSSALPPHRLHLEITESTFVENESKVRLQLEQIQQRQIKISIDDFGTGYSSLSQLQTLPVNYIKIDKTFVDNIEGKGEAIIRATQFIARELNCKTIAEGVESKEQASLLASMGVDYLQGYYFSKPLKNKDLIVWQNPITNTSN